MRKRAILAIVLCLLMASCAFSADKRRFLVYPTMGECTGEGVRIRKSPSTNAKILDALNEYDKVIVLAAKKVKNELWYEIDNPKEEGSAYVFGKYILPAYREEYQRNAFAKMLMDIRLTFGSTEEKNLALLGKPKKTKRGTIEPVKYVTRNFGDFSVVYVKFDGEDEDEEYPSSLKSIQVRDGDKSFGNIKIGDSVSKVRRELGAPENESKSMLEYEGLLYGYEEEADELVDAYTVKFTIEDGEVSSMYFYEREDGEDGEADFYK